MFRKREESSYRDPVSGLTHEEYFRHKYKKKIFIQDRGQLLKVDLPIF